MQKRERTIDRRFETMFWSLLLAWGVVGCGEGASKHGETGRVSTALSSSPALYAAIPDRPVSSPVPVPLRPMQPYLGQWTNASLALLQTELSPALLIRSRSSYLGLFQNMAATGLGGPTHLAFSTPGGPRPFKKGDVLEGNKLEENWVLVWFDGAQGWTNWDSPWAVFLQHKPMAMKLDDDGLEFQFREPAGDVVLMPLYGYYKPPAATNDFLKAHGLPSKKLKTWEWSEFLPRDPLLRLRFWAAATRALPIYCEDTFSVDRARDAVTLRQRFQWHFIEDDWGTQPVKVAPVSPVLGLANLDRQFPATFSGEVFDFEYFTPYGPYLGILNAASYEVTFPVLRYVNEVEAYDEPPTNAPPVVSQALARLQEVARRKFPRPEDYEYDHGGLNNFCWAIQGDEWYAKALPYYDAVTRSNALGSLRTYFEREVLVTNRFVAREYPKGSGQIYHILEGPGIGSWGVLGDAGKFSANLLQTIWAYAHYTGDWALIKERWPLIKTLFTTPAETRWVGFGRDAIAELGDEAAPCLAMARLAYGVGDLELYEYACSLFARELVHHYVKQKGADYFRLHQPWHSMEVMDDEVYLANLWGDSAGWQIDGPRYPEKTGERQYDNRWVRFKSEDVGRFYQDYLRLEVARELNRLGERWEPKRRYHNDSHIMPSLVQLRALLLRESPEALAALATPDQFTGPPSGMIASCLAMVRTSHPARYERLIPGGAPSPFVTGLERQVPGPSATLVASFDFRKPEASDENKSMGWPRVTWWKSWRTPSGEPWNFGEIVVGLPGEEKNWERRRMPLNWNTVITLLSAPETAD